MTKPTAPLLPPQLSFPLGDELTMRLDLVQIGGVCFLFPQPVGTCTRQPHRCYCFGCGDEAAPACDVLVAAGPSPSALSRNWPCCWVTIQYVILRKSRKAYMIDPLVTTVRSITTTGEQQLILDRHDIELLKGKTACFVDDVISTGATYLAAQDLYRRATNSDFAYCVCVATEGKALENNPHNFVRLGHLPLHDMNGNAI